MGNHLETGRLPAHLVDDRQYRLLVEAVTDYAIYMLSPDGVVESWNAGAERFKGYRAAEVIGRNFSIFYALEDQAQGEPQRALDTAAREGRFETEGWRIRKDGSRFWASVVIDPIWEGRKVVGFAKITRDVSERKEAERTLILASEALHQSQKMAAVGQLTAGLASDFDKMLAAVQGSLELLRARLPNDPKAVQLLEYGVQVVHLGTAMTQRVQAFARRQGLAPDAVDVPGLVRGLTTSMQPMLGPGIAVDIHLPPKLMSVLVDAGELETALLHLLVNARDAMPGGGAILIYVLERRLAAAQAAGLGAGSYACLAVKDSGVGMDAATLSRATEPFYSTKGPGKGADLGLSMAHGMAIQAGGRLILKSEVGKGTVAELWLPLVENRAGLEDTTPFSSGRPARVPARVVLAVDDDVLVLLNTVTMLEDLGHKVFDATSGTQALELLRREPAIDLVITDMAMPHMSGLQLYRTAQALYPQLRFVLATGYADASDDDEPALLRLVKPFGQTELARVIQTATGVAPESARVIPFPTTPLR